jgi:hypothetical protein
MKVFHRFFHRVVEKLRHLKCCFKCFPFKRLQAYREPETGRRLAQSDFGSKKNPQAKKIFYNPSNLQYFPPVLYCRDIVRG